MFPISWVLNIPTTGECELCITSPQQTKSFSCHLHCYFQTFFHLMHTKYSALLKLQCILWNSDWISVSDRYLYLLLGPSKLDQSGSVTKWIHLYLKFHHTELWNQRKQKERKKRAAELIWMSDISQSRKSLSSILKISRLSFNVFMCHSAHSFILTTKHLLYFWTIKSSHPHYQQTSSVSVPDELHGCCLKKSVRWNSCASPHSSVSLRRKHKSYLKQNIRQLDGAAETTDVHSEPKPRVHVLILTVGGALPPARTCIRLIVSDKAGQSLQHVTMFPTREVINNTLLWSAPDASDDDLQVNNSIC